jgi:CubicO group peptidase (beta-lactamase class C family)
MKTAAKKINRITVWSMLLSIIALSSYGQSVQIDSLIKKTISDYSIPGMAVGIVKSDSYFYEKGFGSREVDANSPVDANTNFYIASLTKAMTAFSIGKLVDIKLLNWSDPVIKHVKSIQFKEPFSDIVSISDLLSMNLGSPYLDTLMYEPNLSAIELHDAISRHSLSNFRNSNFYGQGANTGFYIAGEIIETVSKLDYPDYLNKVIFEPLKMDNTYVDDSSPMDLSSFAKPHELTRDGLRKVDFPQVGHFKGAVGVVSNVHDLLQWIKMMLGIEYHNHMITKETFSTILRPHNILTTQFKDLFNPLSSFGLYGYGWVLSEYNDKLIAEHFGRFGGYTCLISIIPEDKTGIIILTNLASRNIYTGLRDLKFSLLSELETTK